ncbi:DUF1080 domain-containing protein [Sphingomonas sp. Leaf25]|uniref:3-keto-disaccharide hydrolase n=1 Tax=Sphingomonas sp. Leaf25 TaxID=1735692 RepID=UPI0006F70FD1|nr:DUF1080 domain-containing protein [Sphingomonas sp. Leaf25]KQN06967.1 hypothetical protein ASE78_15225 [Sphingomonas sp. Leaf25]
MTCTSAAVPGVEPAAAECQAPVAPAGSNVVSSTEKRHGWSLLWDGRTSAGWRSAHSESFPATGWTMCNGVLAINGKGGGESRGPGDIITTKRYGQFELQFAFQITPGANSGLKTFVQTNISPIDKVTGKPTPIGSGIGLEFQVLDDELHPDAKLGRDGNRTVGSLYDLIPAPKDKAVLPPGQWNRGRIVSSGRRLTFYLNGRKTIDVDRGSPAFAEAVARSKFKNITGFGEWADGHLLLQDHGDRVFFTDLKVRELKAAR